MTSATQVSRTERHQHFIVRNTFLDTKPKERARERRSRTWPTHARYRYEPLRLGGDIHTEQQSGSTDIRSDKLTTSQTGSGDISGEQAHHHNHTAEHSFVFVGRPGPEDIQEYLPHRISLLTLDVPPTFTFHFALGIALRLEPSVVVAATEQHTPGALDCFRLRACVRNLRHVIPRGLLLFCMPNIGVLHVQPNGNIRTLTRDELGSQILCDYFGYASLALYGTSLSHHARPVCVWLPLHKCWSSPWLPNISLCRSEVFYFLQPERYPLRWQTLCISDRVVYSGSLNANKLLKTRRG